MPLPPLPPPPPEDTDPTPFWDAIFQNSYDFVLVTNAAGRMEYINRTLPGIRPEDVLGTYPEDYFESPVRERVRAAIERVVETGTPQRLDADFTAPDGAEYIFEAKVSPLGQGNPPARLLFNYHDISRRKRLEKELRLRETQMRTALENLPVLVNATGPNHEFVFWNRACERATGYPSGEVIGNPDIWKTFYPDPETREKLLENFPSGRDICDSEWELRAKDGSRKLVSWSAYGGSCPIPGWSNWAVGIDLTDHRRDRRALRATERLHETILNCLPDSVTLCDRAGAILTTNRAAARLRGFDSVPDLLANVETVFDLVHPDDRERVTREAELALDRGDRAGIEYRSITRSGEPIPMELRMIRILDNGGSPFRIVGISRDLREQKAAEARERDREEKLAHAARLASLGVLISGMAHEINNPNHAIQSNAQALRNIWNGVLPVLTAHVEKTPDFRVGAFGFSDLRREMKRAFSNIQESCDRITGIVTDLKEYSRPGIYRRNQLLNLSAVIGRSVRLMEPLLKKATFDFRVELDETPPVIGNGQRLEQVVVNLLQNACIAMEGRPGAVRIETRRGETTETVEIRVEDDGPGIPEENRKRIVEPFFTTRREYGGMGLGLAVSDKIIRDHEGQLVFENRETIGARVRVVLPVAQRLDPSLDENGFPPEPSEQDEQDS